MCLLRIGTLARPCTSTRLFYSTRDSVTRLEILDSHRLEPGCQWKSRRGCNTSARRTVCLSASSPSGPA
ncbi:protein of unknown function [Pararobbsia alpina]